MPFSRASAVMASWISRDMCSMLLGLDEVGSGDGVVRDGDDAGVGGDRHLRLRGTHELTGERLVAVGRLAGANPGAAADEAAGGVRLGGRGVGGGGRDGEGVLL